MKLFLNIFCWWWYSSEINHFSQCYSLVAPLKFSSCFLQDVDMEATEGRLGKVTTFYFLKNKITKITMRSLLHKNLQHLHFFSVVKSAWCPFPSTSQLRADVDADCFLGPFLYKETLVRKTNLATSISSLFLQKFITCVETASL